MPESRGAIFVAFLMAAIVALAIVFPDVERRTTGPIVVETTGTSSGRDTANGPFDALERNEIRNTVRSYLLENPTVIVEALEILQASQQQTEQRRSSDALASHMDRLTKAHRDPSVGNPDASVTIVEFFDYQCPYCKRMAEDVAAIVAANPDVRIVYKEFPVLRSESTLATRAALAAYRQGKYQEFHLAIMGLRGAPSETAIMRVADRLGLDLDRLRRDMQSPETEQLIQANYRLAQDIGVRGTPAFVIGDQLVPGALDADSMRALIAEKRGG